MDAATCFVSASLLPETGATRFPAPQGRKDTELSSDRNDGVPLIPVVSPPRESYCAALWEHGACFCHTTRASMIHSTSWSMKADTVMEDVSLQHDRRVIHPVDETGRCQ